MGEKAVVLVGDCPAGLEFGIDCITYETGPKFKGISSVPYGMHFLYYSYGGFQREGCFMAISSHVQLLSWDRANERFAVIQLTPEAEHMHESEVLSGVLNAHLAPYPQKQHSSWLQLTSSISSMTLQRCHCQINSLLASDLEDTTIEGLVAQYSPLKRLEAAGLADLHASSQPSALTAIGLDRSWLMNRLVAHVGCDSEVLGEMQLAFVLFLFLHSRSALGQWKALVLLACSCSSYLEQEMGFVVSLIKVLYHQLKFIPDDFFEDETISKEFFLEHALKALFSCLHALQGNEDVTEHRSRFQKYIEKKFSMDMSQEAVDMEADEAVFVSELKSDDSLPRQTAVDQAFLDKWKTIQGCMDAVHQDASINPLDMNKMALDAMDQDSSAASPATPVPLDMEVADLPEIASSELEGSKFGWRYPLLYGEMVKADGKEDMIMTAMRVMDDFPPDADSSEWSPLMVECLSFVQNESAFL